MTVKLDPALCRRLAERLFASNLDIGPGIADQLLAATDLAERTLTEERVREVVRAAVAAHWPPSWPKNEHSALLRDTTADSIATRAAKDLAGATVGLSAEERNHLLSIRALLRDGHVTRKILWDAEVATLDRLLYGQTAVVQTETLKPATASIGPADTAIIDRALERWTDAPVALRDRIAAIRALLASPGGGS